MRPKRPKKIYIDPEIRCIYGTYCDFKRDVYTAEYTDLSQVWHDGGKELPDGMGMYIAECIGEDWVTGCSPVYIKDRVKRWAYLSDLLPKGGAE